MGEDFRLLIGIGLNFKKHSDITVARATSVWSLVKRFSKEFLDLQEDHPSSRDEV